MTALSVKSAAAELDVSKDVIYEAIHKQKLPAYRVGRAIRIEKGDLLDWFRSLVRVGSEDDQ